MARPIAATVMREIMVSAMKPDGVTNTSRSRPDYHMFPNNLHY